MNRRNFIKVSGVTGGGLMLSLSLPGQGVAKSLLNGQPLEPNIFLKIDKKGNVTFTLTKLEMGQGSSTGLAQIIADELGANWDKLQVEVAPYDKKYGRSQGTTGGSGSIRDLWKPLRESGAVAREMLVQAAAKMCNDQKANFYTENGYVIHRPKGKKLSFGEVVTTAAKLPVPDIKSIKLKDSKDFKFIGKPITHRRTKDVATGKAQYGINVKLPGMYYAVIARCPVYKGKLVSYDASEAKKIKGVKDVFPLKNVKAKDEQQGRVQEGVVIVANSTWTAMKARKALKIKWDYQGRDNNSVEKLRQKAKTYYKTQEKPSFNRGNVDQAYQDADAVLEGIYEHPFQSHAMMEPLAAVAHYQGNKCEMWVGTQTVEMATKELANVTGLPVSACKVNVLPAGGAFGRRWNTDYVVEAGFISKKINAPVKLMWTREDNMKHGAYHPFQHGIYKAAIKDNKLTAWETKPIHVNHWNGPGTWEYDFIYQTPNMRTRQVKMDYIVETGAWRSVGEHLHGLGRECMMDEVAQKLGKDPIDLRLELLDYEIKKGSGKNAALIQKYAQTIQGRYIKTLRKARQVTNWGKKLPKGKGIGIAVTNFSRTVCAQVAEVTIKNGELTVDKITCITDMGVVVNPHFVTGQMEGGILWALSALKYGGLDIQKGEVVQGNFDTYRVVRMNEVPEIKVHLLESQERPYGAGEPAVPPLAPAILNAIYNATGKRIRKLPVLPKDLA